MSDDDLMTAYLMHSFKTRQLTTDSRVLWRRESTRLGLARRVQVSPGESLQKTRASLLLRLASLSQGLAGPKKTPVKG